MNKTLKFSLLMLVILVLSYFLFFKLIPSINDAKIKSKCDDLRTNFKQYVLQFQDLACVNDQDCVKIGNIVGTCGFCVGKSIDKTKLPEFNTQYSTLKCYNYLSDIGCLAVEINCKCMNNICKFEY